MIRKTALLIGVAVVATTIGFATPASAQATRTWVSGVGDDVNPCSRTAPCKTFAGAISKTAPGGEISCLDPGGFGAVTIIKAMTISCPYTEGGVLAGGNGVVVNAQPADVVFIRGLDIFGVNPPTHGVRFIAGAALHIEDCTIRRFNAANSFGVSFQPGGTSVLYITNSTIADNGNAATGGGINIQPTGVGVARLTMKNVRVNNNANVGIAVNTTGNTGGVGFLIDDSHIIGNTGSGISVLTPAVPINGMINNSTIAHNGGSGLVGNGAAVTVRVGNTTIMGNSFVSGAGVTVTASAQLRTYGNNRLDGNANDGAFTAVVIPER